LSRARSSGQPLSDLAPDRMRAVKLHGVDTPLNNAMIEATNPKRPYPFQVCSHTQRRHETRLANFHHDCRKPWPPRHLLTPPMPEA
jgi:hypothetical protein